HVKIGLTPDCGATYWLARSVPRQLALEIMLGGESVPAQRLLELGLINRIVDSGDALNEAMKWAQKLSEGPFNAQAR
ncbi:enoyl-CoA hydratase-related protein, partial [Klebsiella pneumoniae]|uniref:enoyl-CoA hydratase-related protein n=1 Tax=Klebsiella pneumoniae TaxID=573 RepID=UPI001953FB83